MMKRYGYIWVTLGLFLGTLGAQWVTHSGPTGQFVNAVMENWQSEALQLIWQVLGLKWLLCKGSPASRDGHDRLERKVDRLTNEVAGLRDNSARIMARMEKR